MNRRDHDPDLERELEALLTGVLERTSGPACRRAEELLAVAPGPSGSWAGREEELPEARTSDEAEDALSPVDRELLDLHLAGCAECRALAAALAELARDLPGLAEVRPDPGFVQEVLTATLPAAVRWRRRWRPAWDRFRSESWPRWLRRPRFAWEAAFLLTLVALPIFAAPEAPLQAVPERAIELTRENPVAKLEAPMAELEARLGSAIRAVRRSAPARRLAASRTAVGEWSERIERAGRIDLPGSAERLLEAGRAELGTLFERAASLLESGEETPSANPTDPTEETP